MSQISIENTFDNPDVVNVCTRLLNEATITRMNLTEAVNDFLREIRLVNAQLGRIIADDNVSIEQEWECIIDTMKYFKRIQTDLVNYSKECYSDESPDIYEGRE